MPGILDFLTTSLVPKKGIQDAIDDPMAEYGETEARLRGFLAGATGGAMDTFLSPTGLAGTGVAGKALKALKSVPKGIQTPSRAIQQLPEEVLPTQSMPDMPEVDFWIDKMQRNLDKIPTAKAKQGIFDDAGRQLVEPQNLPLNNPSMKPAQVPHHPAPPPDVPAAPALDPESSFRAMFRKFYGGR